MSELYMYCDAASIIDRRYPDMSFDASAYYSSPETASGQFLVIRLESLQAQIPYNPITAARLMFHPDATYPTTSPRRHIYAETLALPMPEPATYANKPNTVSKHDIVVYDGFMNEFNFADVKTEAIYLQNGIVVSLDGLSIHVEAPFNPRLYVIYEDSVAYLTVSRVWNAGIPTLKKAADNKFYWKNTKSAEFTFYPLVPLETQFLWRDTGSSAVHTVNLTDETEYTLPAGSISGSAIDWKVIVTAVSGSVSETDWQTLEAIGIRIWNASPASGFIYKHKPNVFTWSIQHEDGSGTVSQKSAEFRWQYPGETSYQTISVGTQTSITVPAYTFQRDKILWSVRVATESGYSAETGWYTLSTSEPLSTAIAIAPKSVVVNGSEPVEFTWEHVISTGTAQTSFELQTSLTADSWSTIASEQTSRTSVIIPANTLTGGSLYWRVRTSNADGSAGEWSEPARIIVLAAPPVPSVAIAVSEPRFSIRWETSGQQSYEVRVDGVVVAKKYGAESSFSYQDFVSDGSHTVSVRVQNSLGLWSDWGSAALTVSNDDSLIIDLSVTVGETPVLNWSTNEPYDEFWVYRNGKRIAVTSRNSLVDNFAIGDVEYRVLGAYHGSGYYGASSVVSASVSVKTLTIASVKNPEWLSLALSTSAIRANTISITRPVTYTHYAGSLLPSADVAEAEDRSYQLTCAWPFTKKENGRKLEALIGQTVCIKTPAGRIFVGVMDRLEIEETRLSTSYSATIVPIEWNEEEQNAKLSG